MWMDGSSVISVEVKGELKEERGDRFTFSAIRFLERDCWIVEESLNVVEDSRVFKNV